MPSKFRAFLERVPLKLIVVILFAILIPSLLVTALGVVAVFQADAFVQDRFRRPLEEKVERLRGELRAEWTRRLGIYEDYLQDAPTRRAYLRRLCERDSVLVDLLLSTPTGLERAPQPPPLFLRSREASRELAELERLEVEAEDYRQALVECGRLLATTLEDSVLVEVLLAAARLSSRLDEKDEALEYLRTARQRFGETLDSTGMVREIPILWRIFELERELNHESRALEAAASFAAALRRHSRYVEPAMLEFFQEKLSGLGEPFRPPAPLGSVDSGRLLPDSAVERVAALLPRGAVSGGAGITTHCSLEGLAPLDFVSFHVGADGLWVHLLLDRDSLLEEARIKAEMLGLTPAGLRFSRDTEDTLNESGTRSVASLRLPVPLDNLWVQYFPVEGEVPEGFRGFHILSVATFTWAVIILVLTILMGILFTLHSVLRELRTARMKSDFISFVSHELKTPLTAIRMFTETVLSGRVEDEEEGRLCVQLIDRESDRLSKLIDQILEYSRLEQHQKEFKFQSCDMEEVVEEAVRLFREHNPADSREVEVNRAQKISKIRMDRAAMIELFLNLLSNAAKYSPHETKIVVNLRESIDDISVEVIDQGVGIRKRDQKKIFEKFYRAEDYLTRDVEGTGLGLTFARYIAKVHNGEIRVSSHMDAGSVFTLQLRKTDVLAE